MKKFLGILITMAVMVSSTFALGLSVGGRGIIGGKLNDISEFKNDSSNIADKLTYGGGAYVFVDLFGGLGAQGELNLAAGTNVSYFDIPLMGMMTLNFFDVVSLGVGAGVNFSKVLPSLSTDNVINAAKEINQLDTWNTGFVLGADLKIFFTKHLGLVIGARGIFEGKPNEFLKDQAIAEIENKINISEKDKASKISALDYMNRKDVYANVGLEFRFF